MEHAGLRFEQWKPHLSPHDVAQGRSGNLVLTLIKGGRKTIVLPAKSGSLFPFLDGTRTVQQLVAAVSKGVVKLSIREVVQVLEQCSAAGFLINPWAFGEGRQGESRFFDTRTPAWQKAVSAEILVFKGGRLRRRWLLPFTLIALLIVVSTFGSLAVFPWAAKGELLKIHGSYVIGLLFLVMSFSVLRSLKTVVRLLLLSLGTATLPPVWVRMFGVAAYLDFNDIYLHALPKRWHGLLYVTGSVVTYLFWAGLVVATTGQTDWAYSLGVLAFVMTLIDLSPYRQSDLTKGLSLFCPADRFEDLIPYLKRRCLFFWLEYRTKLRDEIFYVTYASMAVGWSVGFLFFMEELIWSNISQIVPAVLHSPVGLENVAAFIVGSLLTAITLLLIYDVIHTVISNVIYLVYVQAARFFLSRPGEVIPAVNVVGLRDQVRQTDVFASLSDSAIDIILSHSVVRSYGKGSRIIVQGNEGDELFVLLRGKVKVVQREDSGQRRMVASLSPGAVFGELALLTSVQRTADVVALSPSSVLCVGRDTVEKLVSDPVMALEREKLLRRIWVGRQLISSPLFHYFPNEVLSIIATRGVPISVPTGRVVVEQGSKERAFYLIVEGRVDVIRDAVKVNEIGEGGFFGEISVFMGTPRTASIVAQTKCELICLDERAFWDMLSEHVGMAVFIETVAAERLDALAQHTGAGLLTFDDL